MSFEYAVKRLEANDSVAILALKGSLDNNSSTEVNLVLESLFADRSDDVVIDVSKVDYVSSSGWRVLLVHIKNFKDNRKRLKISGMQRNVKEVFELLGLDRVLDCYDTSEDAVKAFQRGAVASNDDGAGAGS